LIQLSRILTFNVPFSEKTGHEINDDINQNNIGRDFTVLVLFRQFDFLILYYVVQNACIICLLISNYNFFKLENSDNSF